MDASEVCTRGCGVICCNEGCVTCFNGCCCFPCTMNELDGHDFFTCRPECVVMCLGNEANSWVTPMWQKKDTERTWNQQPIIKSGWFNCCLGSCCIRYLAASENKRRKDEQKAREEAREGNPQSYQFAPPVANRVHRELNL